MRKLILSGVMLMGCSAFGGIITYDAFLSGPAEPTISPGTGFALVTIDTTLNTMKLSVSFTGLLGTTTASHIHSATAVPFTGTAGVATTIPFFAGFPIGVTSGTYNNTLDLTLASSYNPAFVTANGGTTTTAEAALLAGIAAGESYLNIHSSIFGGGEIRGFLVATPEPGTLAFAAAALAGLVLIRRRR